MFFRLLSRLVESMVILIAGLIVAIVTAEVTLRYLFSHSMIFTEELSRYLMVWIVFLGSALAIRDGSHIRIQILLNRLGPRMQQIVKLAAYALIIVFLIFITVEGLKILPRQLQQMCITIDISLFYFYLAIPVGSILMIIFMLPVIRQTLGGKSPVKNKKE
ncbi:MAG: TRAP transporter small permease [Deltaproteobacteria bacterium]|nr:TRAP transporter small permease [Deltaproteobacteria bacterium]